VNREFSNHFIETYLTKLSGSIYNLAMQTLKQWERKAIRYNQDTRDPKTIFHWLDSTIGRNTSTRTDESTILRPSFQWLGNPLKMRWWRTGLWTNEKYRIQCSILSPLTCEILRKDSNNSEASILQIRNAQRRMQTSRAAGDRAFGSTNQDSRGRKFYEMSKNTSI
jgi:hypothetical protein